MKWKWKPDECDLPVFNPYQFLEIVRDKSLAFVGDSVGRNHMQSLICMLSRCSSAERRIGRRPEVRVNLSFYMHCVEKKRSKIRNSWKKKVNLSFYCSGGEDGGSWWFA